MMIHISETFASEHSSRVLISYLINHLRHRCSGAKLTQFHMLRAKLFNVITIYQNLFDLRGIANYMAYEIIFYFYIKILKSIYAVLDIVDICIIMITLLCHQSKGHWSYREVVLLELIRRV
jgi:hypothetical protein